MALAIIAAMGCRLLLLAAIGLFSAFAQQSDLDGARDAMGHGVHLFQRGNYPEAARAFEKAVQLAPTNLEAKLYLGVCYMAQFHTGSQDPSNLEFAHKAETQFMAILQAEPEDDTALQYMANLSYERAMGIADPEEKRQQLARAKGWFEELEKDVPRNKEAPFTLGVMAWQQAHSEWLSARSKAGMNAADPGPLKDSASRAALAARCGPSWEESAKHLRHALEIDPDFANAMEYLSMVLRERADIASGEDDYRRQIAEAQEWARKAVEARQHRSRAAESDQ